MGQRAKAKANPTPIYRSRQAGRTDIEELLGPAFDPHQRVAVATGDTPSLPQPEKDPHQEEQQRKSLEDPYPLTTVVIAPEDPPTATQIDLRSSLALSESSSAPGFNQEFINSLPTAPTDSVVSGSFHENNDALALMDQQVKSMSTVDVGSPTTVDIAGTTDLKPEPPGTVGTEDQIAASENLKIEPVPALDDSALTVPTDYRLSSRWITEQGQAVSEKQVRPFKIAQEVLNSNERVLYTVLWNHREAKTDPQDPHVRTVRAGYDLLAKQTNLAKKTIQRLIPRLIQKDFLRLKETPDFYNRVATSYQVLSYKRVLEIAAERGRTHVAKLGHGIAFVRKCSPVPSNETRKPPGTVVNDPLSTVVPKSTVSVPNPSLSTVVRKSTILESRLLRNRETTTAPPELFERLETLVPEIDTGAVERIWREAREVLSDIQPEEIAFWFEQRARLVYQNRGLTNPLGLLLSSIKDWLTERKIITRRNQLREWVEEEQRVRQQLENDQQKGGGNGRHELG